MIAKEEVPVVNKEARVVEEVTLNKEVNEREETVRDTVRNTEVDVEKTDGDKTNRDYNKGL
jgi:stress response protein YsnF